jgi:CHRD domain
MTAVGRPLWARRPLVCGCFLASPSRDIVYVGRPTNFGSTIRPKKREDKSMQTAIIRSVLIGSALFAIANSAAVAETLKYKSVINAQNVTTPNDSKGTGTAEVTYDTATKTLSWDINFDGLTGPPTMAHFHGPAAPGANAGVALMIGTNPTSPAKGTATLTDAQAADLQGGLWYINIHTAANRGGEIRGQVVK